MILWNYPSQCPKCECTIVHPTWSSFRPTKPEHIAFQCAEQNCQHRWEVDALFTGPRGSGMPQSFIAHIRIKNLNTHCTDEKCTTNTGVLIDPLCNKCTKLFKSGKAPTRLYRCETRLVFGRDEDSVARVVLKGFDDHTVEQADFHSIERLIVDNAERSREDAGRDP